MALSKVGDVGFLRLTMDDFDEKYNLEALPDDYECPICMMVKEEMMECR